MPAHGIVGGHALLGSNSLSEHNNRIFKRLQSKRTVTHGKCAALQSSFSHTVPWCTLVTVHPCALFERWSKSWFNTQDSIYLSQLSMAGIIHI
ncbi:hypothetical protein GDO86_001407 [Hymenochirus boettgeri]|uniref:Uncharacterized protein n=1 Tax=Hymenochirus boettgeri TaxID=247094 RepID=A0A8T2KEM6_9PIPI|nr:hypothetical protein GDO86_001407 [Hymenochirus boettgeri]